ncbi:MAG: bifunctional methylenetetrahydrofolate dehydrogenase/methenyltetrahydrofolate cyclohydrolase FolD [Clostridia bacterium]|nr:bifunctional methylenetetrahydrofolate dehydrogenase/methenyltetrahydrofolate cyclohydrolase FolD [Clostridia bacterium]
MAELIDGKLVAARLREEIRRKSESLKASGRAPGLAVILVGEDPASQVYVKNKEKACAEVGFYSEKYLLPESTSEEELTSLIKKLNADGNIDGILVQSPVPKHIDYSKIVDTIDPSKDVDAFSPVNVGKIMLGTYSLAPCTPAGIIELIKSTGTDISGKNCVVIGRSNIVGKPMAMLLMHENGTVTVCHSKTKDLKAITSNADILVSSVGKAGFLTADMVKPGAVVIDVGMNRDANGKLTGDAVFDEVSRVASFITPVPGGVGPMTITMLLKNTLTARKLHSR